MRIWANTMVRNEERFVWYSLMSVIDHVDKILIWDTGSDDNTPLIIKEAVKLYPEKIKFEEVGKVDIYEFTSLRQKMLAETKSDWFIILDGDEVWWDESIRNLVKLIRTKGNKLESVISPYYNLVGDIYHYQHEFLGKYKIDSYKGHINIRATNKKIAGLHFANPHGQLALQDSHNLAIQLRDKTKRVLLDAKYLHFTNLMRSQTRENDSHVPKRSFKYKYDVGLKFPFDFYYPESFFRPRPKIVSCVWEKRTIKYEIISRIQKPLKYAKESLTKNDKSGY